MIFPERLKQGDTIGLVAPSFPIREEELAELWQQDNCDWIYIRGQVHFHERFLENLLKTRADYRNRDLQGEKGPDRNRELLQENVLRAKEEGCRRIRIPLPYSAAFFRYGSPL